MEKPTMRRAAAEFLAIFLGVTLGLIADDWRQNREDAADARAALVLVHDDLVGDSTNLANVVGHLESHVAWTAWIQSNWNRTSMDADSVGLAFRAYLFQNNPTLRTSAYTSLKSSNGLSLIESVELRNSIIDYYDRRQADILAALEMHDVHRLTLLTEIIADHALHPPGRTPGTVWPVVAEPSRLTSSWQEIQADNRVYNQSMAVGAYADLALRMIRRAQEYNARLRAHIMENIDASALVPQ